MADHISDEANPETRGTVPVQFFEAAGGVPALGTKATPRPADRPRELQPDSSASATFRAFDSEAASQ
jgi:hypothetical protein